MKITVPFKGLVVLLLPSIVLAGGAGSVASVQKLKDALPDIIEKSAAHYRVLDAAATPRMWNKNGKPMVPRGFDHEKREITMDPIHGWRTGHYPGALWLLHEATGDAFFRERATVWTELLEPNRNLDWHHDVGFIIM